MNLWCQEEIGQLIEKIAKAKTAEEVTEIFEKVLTPREINDIARRLKVWEMLEAGKSYLEIQDKLKVSTGFISKVSAGIGYGFRRTNVKVLSQTSNKTMAKRVKTIKGARQFPRIFFESTSK